MPTTPDRVLARALAEVGTKESPPGSNSVKYNQWYYGRDAREPWCAAFVSWCFYNEDLPLPASTAKGFVYTPAGAAWFRRNNRWAAGTTRRPERGWVVFYDFPGDDVHRISHVGIVDGFDAGGIWAIEGNTNRAGSRTGGEVLRVRRRWSGGIEGYGIPDFDVGAPTRPRIDLPPWRYEEEDVDTKLIEISLDPEGKGWNQWDPGYGVDPVVVGLVAQGPYPPVDGYWDDPDEDLTFRAQPRGGTIVVTATNGPPNGVVYAWVSAARPRA